MKKFAILASAALIVGLIWSAWSVFDDFFAPLFFNSRIERLHETGLPRAFVEKGGTIYCRMKADDFRFPLPPGSRAVPPVIISGGFDWVDGSVVARFESSNRVAPGEYESWASSRLQEGAYITADSVPGGLAIKFHYFGDR